MNRTKVLLAAGAFALAGMLIFGCSDPVTRGDDNDKSQTGVANPDSSGIDDPDSSGTNVADSTRTRSVGNTEDDISLKVHASAEGGAMVSYGINGYSEWGVKIDNNNPGIVNINEYEKSFDLDIEHYVKGKFHAGILAGIESKLYGVAGLNVGAGPAVELNATGDPFGVHVYENGFHDGQTDNEIRLDFGVDYSARAVLKILGKSLVNWQFAGNFIVISNLERQSFLPNFTNPTRSEDSDQLLISSSIKRDFLNYPVKDYGVCVEIPNSNQCKNGDGVRETFGSVSDGKLHEFSAVFNSLQSGTYDARPYFSNGMGGTFYDKATTFKYAGYFTDERDGQRYRMVTIGAQTWMAENLNYLTESGSVCYENNLENCAKYGRLYDWSAVKEACPVGWHLPRIAEWDAMFRYVDSKSGGNGKETEFGDITYYQSNTAGRYLKATNGWNDYNSVSGNGTDAFDFAALPGGYGYLNDETFYEAGNYGYWWSTYENYITESAYYRLLDRRADYESIGHIISSGYVTNNMYSVRCVRN